MDLSRKVDRNLYPRDTGMPEYPALSLTTHVLVKGLQVGSVAGTILSPVWSVSRRVPLISAWHAM